ncbi:SLAP domain-containing protein [Lactobacillus crispatus]|uniref:SLAP domain-containing protein n=1 Tax=Lactobacillus crispatus TaxID=47770 RepID=UPI0029C498EC|nr:SLAP domain-containing protein [Lactobacillus crispatus]MDX5113937.1 SLAP domain-containing protein [Lactobacillus crispatus]MDX5121281.1 SLAP domain-containing protein [Lactobacillus crispatus]MDX5126889.1 SLAP domain-containing protein [Lactobacillus crispatus]MDX5135931.1 SLAP domain-containing protein [Lactobacillus crispatus]
MKKQNIKKLVASAVLTIGLISPMAVTNQSGSSLFGTTNIVQAATRKITLTHNAYIYNYRGRRVGRRVLHKYTTHTYFSVRKIHGKRYYRIGHNRYVKAGNARTISSDSKRTITPASINTSSLGSPIFKVHVFAGGNDVYKNSSDNSWFGAKDFKDGIYNVYASKNGKYEIGQNLWISEDAGEKVNGTDTTNTSSVNNSSTSSNKVASSKKKHSNSTNQDKLYNSQDIQEVKKYFVKDLNDWREKQGLKPFTLVTSGWLADGANVRANDNVQLIHQTGDFDHVRPNGQPWYTAFAHPYELKGGALTSVSDGSNPEDCAYGAFYRLIYEDAESNWGHKKELQENLSSPKMAIGIAYFSPNNLVLDVVTADYD